MTSQAAERSPVVARLITLGLALGLWFLPAPEGVVPAAWHLFALFVSAIASVVIGAFPILTASVLALSAAVLTGTLTPKDAYSGFSNSTILLIVVAFLVARASVRVPLGRDGRGWQAHAGQASSLVPPGRPRPRQPDPQPPTKAC